MLTLVDIYNHIVVTRANKDQSGGTYRINQYNTDLKVANMEMFSDIYGLPEEYQAGNPFPKKSFEITQKILDDLHLLKVNMGGGGQNDPSPLEVQNGKGTIPKDYLHWVSMNYTLVEGEDCNTPKKSTPNVDLLTDAQWAARVDNVIRNRNVKKYPYCNIQRDYIRFRPEWAMQYVNFVYLRAPKDPYLDYVVNPGGTYTFLAQGQYYLLQPGQVYRLPNGQAQTAGQVISLTQEFEWPVDVVPNFGAFILGYISDNLRQPFLKQSAEKRKDSGK